MISINYLLDILKYLIAGLGVVGVAFVLIKPYIQRAERIQILEIKKSISNQTLPLRLQAYERMVLLIERVNPSNLLVRINAPAYTPQELHVIVLNEISTEYQHNISQQIYVSNEAWQVVKKVKEDTINLFNNVIRTLPENATGMDVSRLMLTHLNQLETDPYDIATAMIKKDLDFIF
ncbi:DUF7935 family protein [Mucilaginibacter polytrichastri]|uniref:Uncharacterized protein n=1 Tax=Mucilaginibacter polytrichastri TaxID=1302689 RepID=A0A1Q6A2P1_9SPHI|nr:hypothetical protein [Mucilaginibacter polytrichastri]OKS88285.1 hypothetical protein RG47T_3751 [Mucilaginibacter polytrichastri]SFT13377.1 hypothetical protein SAMN04487890_11223 [Mucilaginibacter polytrichastri]